MTMRHDCEAFDRDDPFASFRDRFSLSPGMIYLDGNSLGALPKSAIARVSATLEAQWGETLIKSWNEHGWFDLPRKVGDRVARLIGAPKGSVIAGDTISVNLFKLLSGGLRLRSDRKVILSDSGNFPSDLYVAQELASGLGRGHVVKTVDPGDVVDAIDDSIAVVMLTEVDYRTSRLHDMKAITEIAHRHGALIIWDLAHSAGAMPIDLAGADADFAVGCTYKYLNGGPGAPAFLYVRPDLQNEMRPALAGWWGHAAPFAFDPAYRPADGIVRMQCGTQPILSMAALDAALDIWDNIDLTVLRGKAQKLCGLFIDLVEARCGKHGVALMGPRDPGRRGSHVSLSCPEGYAVMQALIARGVIGDFRAPDMIRFGFTPLYTRFVDVWDAADHLARILGERLWDTPEFRARKAVT